MCGPVPIAFTAPGAGDGIEYDLSIALCGIWSKSEGQLEG
jgi:hypothetical protein